MRRLLGPILVGIGAFLVVTGVLARFYAYPALAVAPMDQNSVTELAATDATILDLSTYRRCTTDMSVVNRTVGDVKASEDAGDDTGRLGGHHVLPRPDRQHPVPQRGALRVRRAHR